MSEHFIFGIPLISREAAGDWQRVDDLFALTLRSIKVQTDAAFNVVLAGHEAPASWHAAAANDPRFSFIAADWTPEPPSVANDDGGRKKWMIKQHVRQAGGGLLMFLDADDWLACDVVEHARSAIRPGDVGAMIAEGYAVDFESFRQMPFPMGDAYDGPIYDLCGSTTIGRIVPGSLEPVRLDPHAVLGSHHEWVANAARGGLTLAHLPTSVAYVVGTGQNHSERQGPFAEWRRALTEAVRTRGRPFDAATAALFGQNPAACRTAG